MSDPNGRESILFRDALALVKTKASVPFGLLLIRATLSTKYGWTATKKEPELHGIGLYTAKQDRSISNVWAIGVTLTSLMSDSGLDVQRMSKILKFY